MKIKLENFEGPLDLLFHLIEKSQINIYDIPISDITDQYMDYLFAMQEMDLEIASEFLVMAATLLHIKSRMLLPTRVDKTEEELDPREELVIRLLEYKKYKEAARRMREWETKWEGMIYKLPDVYDAPPPPLPTGLDPAELERLYKAICIKNIRKMNRNEKKNISEIVKYEKVSLRHKIREVVDILIRKPIFRFKEYFSVKKNTRMEIVTSFLAVLELAKMRKVLLVQENFNDDLVIQRNGNEELTLSSDHQFGTPDI